MIKLPSAGTWRPCVKVKVEKTNIGRSCGGDPGTLDVEYVGAGSRRRLMRDLALSIVQCQWLGVLMVSAD